MVCIYCDANAGVAALPEAVRAYAETAQYAWANPSSPHPPGAEAAAALCDARARVAKYLGVDADAIVLTSGGTEANALAILGSLGSPPGSPNSGGPVQRESIPPHVVTTAIEHPSVARTLLHLAETGQAQLTVVKVARDGQVRGADVLAACRADTRLVSCVAVCNETGVVQPTFELSALLRARGIPLHSDAVQAIGRIPVGELGAPDLLVLSGHKVGAVAGIGVLVHRGGPTLQPVWGGGGQEHGRRSGTENVAGAASLAAALAALPDRAQLQRVQVLRDGFEVALQQALSGVEILGAASPRVANTSCVRFEGCAADGLLMALDLEGIAVSTGSACSSGSIEPSPILLGMGLSRIEAKQVLRFSFLSTLTAAEVERVHAATVRVVRRMRGARC